MLDMRAQRNAVTNLAKRGTVDKQDMGGRRMTLDK